MILKKLRNISYEMRLKECGLTTLETRRLRGDQIEVFKILNGYEHIDSLTVLGHISFICKFALLNVNIMSMAIS